MTEQPLGFDPDTGKGYDTRYKDGSYEKRFSNLRVLETERIILQDALNSTIKNQPDEKRISILDFGIGSGRVTVDELLLNDKFHDLPNTDGKDLIVIAYDISQEGLNQLALKLETEGFASEKGKELNWKKRPNTGYIAGDLVRETDKGKVTVRLVQGIETESADRVAELLQSANDSKPVMLTTAWYDALMHIPNAERRDKFFEALGKITSGEMLAECAAGKEVWPWVAEYNAIRTVLKAGKDLPDADNPILKALGTQKVKALLELPGDVLYSEISRINPKSEEIAYLHNGGAGDGLLAHMQHAITDPATQEASIQAGNCIDLLIVAEHPELDALNTKLVTATNGMLSRLSIGGRNSRSFLGGIIVNSPENIRNGRGPYAGSEEMADFITKDMVNMIVARRSVKEREIAPLR